MHPTFEIHLEKTWLARLSPCPDPSRRTRRAGRNPRSQDARLPAKRLGVMLLTALCLTLIVFSLVNLKPNLVKLAKEQTGSRITEQQVEVWLDQNGFNRPFAGALRRVARRRGARRLRATRRGSTRRSPRCSGRGCG